MKKLLLSAAFILVGALSQEAYSDYTFVCMDRDFRANDESGITKYCRGKCYEEGLESTGTFGGGSNCGKFAACKCKSKR